MWVASANSQFATVTEKTIYTIHVSPCSADTLVRRGGTANHHSIAYSLSNISAKNYQNRLMCVEVIVCNIRVVCWRHSVCKNVQDIPLSSRKTVSFISGVPYLNSVWITRDVSCANTSDFVWPWTSLNSSAIHASFFSGVKSNLQNVTCSVNICVADEKSGFICSIGANVKTVMWLLNQNSPHDILQYYSWQLWYWFTAKWPLYFRSDCLSVCLFVCAEFFSAVFNLIWIKLGHMLHVRV